MRRFILFLCCLLVGGIPLQATSILGSLENDLTSVYRFGKWVANSTHQTAFKSAVEAGDFFVTASKQQLNDYKKGIIHEDYPGAFSFNEIKEAALADINSEIRCFKHPYISPAFDGPAPGSIVETPMGVRGLCNDAGECYIDAALQTLRVTLLPLAQFSADSDAVSFPTSPELNKNISYLPNFRKFLRNQIVDNAGTRALRREMAQFINWRMIERPWPIVQNSTGGDNAYMGESGTGTDSGGEPAPLLRAWLYLLLAPASLEVGDSDVLEKNILQSNTTYHYAAHLRELRVPKLEQESNLELKLKNMKQVIEDDLAARGRKITSLPPVVSFNLSPSELIFSKQLWFDYSICNFLTLLEASKDILDPFTLSIASENPARADATVTLKPVNISVGVEALLNGDELVGHAFNFIQENGAWYEVNNMNVFPIPKEWEEDLKFYLSREVFNAIMSYAVAPEITTPLPAFSPDTSFIAAPSAEESFALHRQFRALSVDQKWMLLNFSFYWWAFYKHHPEFVP